MEPGDNAPKLKEIYSYYGYSMFLSQALEGLLVQAIYTFIIFPSNENKIKKIVADNSLEDWENFVDSKEEKLIRKTMGMLLHELRNKANIDPSVENTLKTALEKRNYLAHQFFKDNLENFYSEEGQDNAIMFIRKSGGLIQKAINELGPIVSNEMEKFGYDQEYVEKYARNRVEEAQKCL